MRLSTKQGQGIFEYILVIAALLLALMVGAVKIRDAVQVGQIGASNKVIENAADQWLASTSNF